MHRLHRLIHSMRSTDWGAPMRRPHTLLHLVAIGLFLGSWFMSSPLLRDVGLTLSSLVGVVASVMQSFWAQQHAAGTRMGQAIEVLAGLYLIIGAFGAIGLYLAWVYAYALP